MMFFARIKKIVLSIAFVVISFSFIGCQPSDTPSDTPLNTISVPFVIGMKQDSAESDIINMGLMVGSVTEEYSDTVEYHKVISQDPEGGSLVAPGTSVNLIVSKGKEKIIVPDVIGLSRADGEAMLNASGFVVNYSDDELYSNTVEQGNIAGQEPEGGTSYYAGTEVYLGISLGAADSFSMVGDTPTGDAWTIYVTYVPTGITYEFDYEVIIEGIATENMHVEQIDLTFPNKRLLWSSWSVLNLKIANEEVTDWVHVGQTEQIKASFDVFVGDRVRIIAENRDFVGKGTANLTFYGNLMESNVVPDVTGMPQADAEIALVNAGFTVGTISYVEDDSVASGHVLSQVPQAGEIQVVNSPVALSVAQYAIVPNVAGMLEAEAAATIEEAGLAVGVAIEYYDWIIEKGNVIRTVPGGNTVVEPGHKVDIIVSLGKPVSETVLLPGEVPLEIVWVPEGTYTMGRYPGEQDSNDTERPPHSVTLKGFWMGKQEITKRQWQAVMGTNPWSGFEHVLEDPDSSAVYISWNDVHAFIDALNAHLAESGQTMTKMRLPSESEWEYACRAGTVTRFFWGDDPTYTDISDFAWWDGNAFSLGNAFAHIVGMKYPNAYGLYDMNGNVWEWCEDDWHDNYTDAPRKGQAWIDSPRNQYRVFRGGGLESSGDTCRSAFREKYAPQDLNYSIGFRVAI